MSRRSLHSSVLVVLAGALAMTGCGGDDDSGNSAPASTTTVAAASTDAGAGADDERCAFVDLAAFADLVGHTPGELTVSPSDGVFLPPVQSGVNCALYAGGPDPTFVGGVTVDVYATPSAAAEDFATLVATYGGKDCWDGSPGGATELDGVGEQAVMYACGTTVFALKGDRTVAVGVDPGSPAPDPDAFTRLAADVVAGA